MVDQQHGSTVAIQKRMPVCKQAHDLAKFVLHGLFVLSQPKAIVHRSADVLRLAKQHIAFGDGLVWRSDYSILPSPWVVIDEQNPMDFEEVLVLQVFLAAR